MGHYLILSIKRVALHALMAGMCLCAKAQRQTANQTSSWFMFFGTHRIAPKWSLHSELQWRRSNGFLQPQQNLLRTGINYHMNADVFITVGHAFVHTYPYGAFPAKTDFSENRLWEQIQVKSQAGALEVISRLRIEQRWMHQPVLQNGIYKAGDAVYQNRFRLLNRISMPFKGKKILDKSFYFSVYDEILINAGKNVGMNIFDQNRAYLALGYKIPAIGRLEIGYMQQTVMKSDGIRLENNHTFMLGINTNLDFYKPTKQN